MGHGLQRAASRAVRLGGLLLLAASAGLPSASAQVQDEREARLESMQLEIRRLETEVRNLGGRERGVLGQLERLSAELRLQQAQLQEVEVRLDQMAVDLHELNESLGGLEEAQGERKRYLAFRLREIYKSGQDSGLRGLFTESEVESYWQGVGYASYLSERDGRVLEAYRRDTGALADRRQELESSRAELDAARAELDSKRSELQNLRRREQAALRRLREDVATRESAIDELREASVGLARVIEEVRPERGDVLDVHKFKGLLDWPADGPVTAEFGPIVHPRFKTRVPHPGIDIGGDPGAAIRTVFEGTVVFAAWMRGYGLTAIVDHGGGLLSIYAHASMLLVEPGEKLVRGQRLGLIGETGSLKGPHLYFELRVEGEATDPASWLRGR
ncbi:MAG: peptidoglycan DD-metalloendopeptidase family protein [bacterium]|nr:peptidoglycan DD-metalloendopeptidase family protein [bacterium]